MKTEVLALGDLSGQTESEILSHIESSWQVKKEDLRGVRLLICYESVGDYGCDSSGFFLFKKGRKFFEAHGSHCSCYGFEGQWEPEQTSLKYLRSDKFSFSTGGYDGAGTANVEAARQFLRRLVG